MFINNGNVFCYSKLGTLSSIGLDHFPIFGSTEKFELSPVLQNAEFGKDSPLLWVVSGAGPG